MERLCKPGPFPSSHSACFHFNNCLLTSPVKPDVKSTRSLPDGNMKLFGLRERERRGEGRSEREALQSVHCQRLMLGPVMWANMSVLTDCVIG